MTDRVEFAIFYGMEDEEEIPSGTFPDTREEEADERENAEQAARLDAAWQAVPLCPPPCPPDWIPARGARDMEDYRVLTTADPVERNRSVTVDGYVRREKYDESVNEFNNLKSDVDRPESSPSTVSSRDDEMMTI